MTDPTPTADEAALQRRRFLRGGALLAAAAGGAVAASATGATPASAATGDSLLLGQSNTADATTTIESQAEKAVPLRLTNGDGPALELSAAETDSIKSLTLNQFAGTVEGPIVSAYDVAAQQPYTDYIATLWDVYADPVLDWVAPTRILDTRTSKGRAAVVAKSSAGALDSKGRLTKGSWIDVAVDSTDQEYTPAAAFVTLTSSGSKKDGALTAYVTTAGRGGTVTVSFIKKKTLSGSAFVGLRPVKGTFAFRIYASQTTYVSVDLTGLSYYNQPGPDANPEERRAARSSRLPAARPRHRLGR